MLFENKAALSKARMEHSYECLQAAKSLMDIGSYKSSANRSYYAIFHAMRAVLAYDGIDMKHHSGVISEFRRLYIKTGIFDTRLSEIISLLFDVRTDSDYDDFFRDFKERCYRTAVKCGEICIGDKSIFGFQNSRSIEQRLTNAPKRATL